MVNTIVHTFGSNAEFMILQYCFIHQQGNDQLTFMFNDIVNYVNNRHCQRISVILFVLQFGEKKYSIILRFKFCIIATINKQI